MLLQDAGKHGRADIAEFYPAELSPSRPPPGAESTLELRQTGVRLLQEQLAGGCQTHAALATLQERTQFQPTVQWS
jgi:hypothetical protein